MPAGNARSSNEQRLILNDLSFLAEPEQKAIKALERQLVDTISDLLIRLDTEGKIVKRSKKVYAMMLFGMLNFSHTWYDPKGDIAPQEFADMVVDLFLHGFTAPTAKGAASATLTAGRPSKKEPPKIRHSSIDTIDAAAFKPGLRDRPARTSDKNTLLTAHTFPVPPAGETH